MNKFKIVCLLTIVFSVNGNLFAQDDSPLNAGVDL
jgi:hypothetical protein